MQARKQVREKQRHVHSPCRSGDAHCLYFLSRLVMFVEFEMQSWYGLLWIKQYCNIHTNQDLVVIKNCGKTRVEESMHIYG